MAPAQVKCYGLFWITRRTYLWVQFIGLLICIALIVIGLSVMLHTGVYIPHVPDMKVQDDLIYQILIGLFWLGSLFLLAGAVETIVMLRKFSRVVAQQKASPGNVDPVEPIPSAPGATAVPPPPSDLPTTNPQP